MSRFTAVRQFSLFSIAATIAAGQLAVASPAHAQATYSILHSFTGVPLGPRAGLIQGPDGTLYGTSSGGGTAANLGTIFQMAPDGSSFALLHSFTGAPADGQYPYAGLIQGPDGTLYGTTFQGGTANLGTVFRLAPDGSGFTLLHSFTGAPTDGQNPSASLIQGPDGTLYGTTEGGGGGSFSNCHYPFIGCGTVFQLAPDGSSFTILYSFTGTPTDGRDPFTLIQGPDGTLYGTTEYGGSADWGTVFQMAPDGSGFTLLHSFIDAPPEGGFPLAGLIHGPDGTLYGTTPTGGGSGGRGTVFRLAPDGSGFTLLHSFISAPTDGAFPYAALIQGPDGTLYGTTFDGGTANIGTVFRLAPDGSGFTLLYSFTGAPTDGSGPVSGLIQGPDGTLYGTTEYGGSGGTGTVFRLAPDGSGFTLLQSFSPPTDGAYPDAGLIQGPDGTFYGTTNQGGTANLGAIFQMAPDGSSFTLLYSFTGAPTDGQSPQASLIQGPDGTLYGTTLQGGTASMGTVFRLAPDGSGFALLHSFTGTGGDGQNPSSLIQGPDGTLYGTTSQGGSSRLGTVFRLAPDGSGFTLLHSFTSAPTNGQYPEAGLIQGPDGTLYGTTSSGGSGGRCPSIGDHCGTVFRLAPDGTGFTLLHSFTGPDGVLANGLIQGPDGTLYGTTATGGSGYGTLFQMAPDGSGFTLLHTFTGAPTDGQSPAGLIQGPDGTLYGTTAGSGNCYGGLGCGTVFWLAPDGSGFTLLHSFTGAPDGAVPRAGLIQGPDGTLYGTTHEGGSENVGTVFQLSPDGSGFAAPTQLHRRGQRAHSGQVEHPIR